MAFRGQLITASLKQYQRAEHNLKMPSGFPWSIDHGLIEAHLGDELKALDLLSVVNLITASLKRTNVHHG